MQVWPFPPRQDFIEGVSWYTNVIRAKSAEQRIALRTAPRREFSFQNTLTDNEYAAARAMVRGAELFLVPDWPQAVAIGAIAAGSDVAVSDDGLAYSDFYDGSALLWQSPDVYEVVEIAGAGADYVIDEVLRGYSNAYLMPVLQAHLVGGITVQRRPARLHEINVAFDVFQNSDLGQSDYIQYRGHDVLTECPVVGSGMFSESLSWEFSVFDNVSGVPEYIRQRTLPDLIYQMRWHVFSKSALAEVRRWIHSRRGRQKVFWMSSLGQDFLPALGISAPATAITVFKLPGIADLGRDESFDIEIRSAAGVIFYRRVVSATAGSPVNGSATIVLTISSSLGTALSLAQIERISFLRCTRFNSDRIEFNHRASSGTVIQVPCIEVPLPA